MSGSKDEGRRSRTRSVAQRPLDDADDRALVEGLRRADSSAVDELIRRFEPRITRYARSLGVPPSECRHWAGDLLYEIALTLGRGRIDPPRNLAGHVEQLPCGTCCCLWFWWVGHRTRMEDGSGARAYYPDVRGSSARGGGGRGCCRRRRCRNGSATHGNLGTGD